MTKLQKIKKQALYLAEENKKAEPDIRKIYWFPNEKEVRLIEITENISLTGSDFVEPFYFDSSPSENLPAPSGIAMIRPEEFRRLTLPEDWGDWEKAEELRVQE